MLLDGKVVGLHVGYKLKTEYPNADFSLKSTVIELSTIFREYVLQILRNFIEKLVELELSHYILFTTLQEEAINFKNNAIACFKAFLADDLNELTRDGLLKRTIDSEVHAFNYFAKEQARDLDLGGMISSIRGVVEYLDQLPENAEIYLEIIGKKINPLVIDMHTDIMYIYNEFLMHRNDSVLKQFRAGGINSFYTADYQHNMFYFFHIIAYALWQTSFKELNGHFDEDIKPWISIANPIDIPGVGRTKHINIKL